jgi:hypothetical protein
LVIGGIIANPQSPQLKRYIAEYNAEIHLYRKSTVMANNIDVPIQASQASPSDKDTALSRKDKIVVDSGDSISQEEKNTRTESPSQENKRKGIRSVFIMQFIIFVLMVIAAYIYGWLHNIPTPFSLLYKSIEDYYEAIANFNFIGVSPENLQPTIYAVILETLVWSFLGVLARSAYSARQSMRGGKFSILEAITKLIADSMMGISITIAVVAFLRTTEFVNLSLKSADIGSIIAISFILGFYHEDTRRLLGSFQKRISGSVDETKESEKEK